LRSHPSPKPITFHTFSSSHLIETRLPKVMALPCDPGLTSHYWIFCKQTSVEGINSNQYSSFERAVASDAAISGGGAVGTKVRDSYAGRILLALIPPRSHLIQIRKAGYLISVPIVAVFEASFSPSLTHRISGSAGSCRVCATTMLAL